MSDDEDDYNSDAFQEEIQAQYWEEHGWKY
jgi:hypothetical protein